MNCLFCSPRAPRLASTNPSLATVIGADPPLSSLLRLSSPRSGVPVPSPPICLSSLARRFSSPPELRLSLIRRCQPFSFLSCCRRWGLKSGKAGKANRLTASCAHRLASDLLPLLCFVVFRPSSSSISLSFSESMWTVECPR